MPGGRNVERQTVSIMKACELVGVSRRTIYNWIAASKVEYVRTSNFCVVPGLMLKTYRAACR